MRLNSALLFGLGMLALGGIITWVSYNSTAPGGRYVITTGLFLVGGINVIRGLYYATKEDRQDSRY